MIPPTVPRTRVPPIEPMALRLACHREQDRTTPSDAARLLLAEAEFHRDDIVEGVDAALAMARAIAAGAASDALWARCLGYLRDGLATLTLLVGGSYLWSVTP